MRTRVLVSLTATLLSGAALPSVTYAKKKPKPAAAAAPRQASAQTAKAISDLSGKFKWGMSPEEAIKVVTDGIQESYAERLSAERDAFKQDKVRREMNAEIERVKESFIKFDGHKTGWDVSIVDHEFAQNDEESMFLVKEAVQRRFLFFWHDKLWKQFIAFNADHPAFQGKSFDDFADAIQRRYGAAQVTFRKQRSSDEQAFDHLEWPPSGDYTLWAIDMTTLYNNYCLSLMQTSVMKDIEKARESVNPNHKAAASSLVDMVTGNSGKPTVDDNADIVDQITGRQTGMQNPPPAPDGTPQKPRKTAPATGGGSESNDPLGGL